MDEFERYVNRIRAHLYTYICLLTYLMTSYQLRMRWDKSVTKVTGYRLEQQGSFPDTVSILHFCTASGESLDSRHFIANGYRV